MAAEFGNYAWIMDPLNKPWKLQCPACRRYFPSNDFGGFYNLGIGEDGKWSYELAKEKNAALVAEGKDGYLKNIENPEWDTTFNAKNWGVDDGYGYRTGKQVVGTNGAKQEETHTYMGYYNHWGVWYDLGNNKNGGVIQDAVDTLREAYMYTGDAKYGRVGAALVDRVADIYPDMFIKPYFPRYFNSDSTTPRGKIIGCIWEHGLCRTMVRGYDAFYAMYDDPQVRSFLGEKAAKYNMPNKKETPTQIRQNCEDGLLREAFKSIKSGNINGNFGMHQSLAAYCAVVLDTMPETKEMADWVFKSSTDTIVNSPTISGGNVTAQIINRVDRDGHGSESAPNYNWLWTGNLMVVADVFAGYKTYEAADMYKDPKYVKMFKAMFPLTLTRKSTAAIGDSGDCGGDTFIMNMGTLMKGFVNTKDPEIAQFIYLMNGNKTDGLHAESTVRNPESVQAEIQAIIDKYGEYDLDRSQQLSGYGFSILRGGEYVPANIGVGGSDTQRDFWMYYGGANSHRHPDTLNLGIDAYGFNMAPEFGYPEAADGANKSVYWGQATLNHNTVLVDAGRQSGMRSGTNGTPLHFDDSG
ncbi:MAG: hypothetical protein RR994_02555, partial [Clostridia bacterium]